ncbi:MAG TPA: GntR family transcriptional regulator [Solirubrobacterales bacterium]|nr:GntR family transcriptional regulator [Solirubrobacterales bacterium]
MAHQPSTESAPDLVRTDDLPLGAQLAWRLRALIGSGQLGPGDRLPGVRELASGAGVNVNTARAVYRRLEEHGLIESRHGLGTFVADDAPVSPDLERLAAEAAESAIASGVDPRDLARAIYAGTGPWDAELAPPAGAGREAPPPDFEEPNVVPEVAIEPGAEADERLGRRELRRQIARLETQLASYPADARRAGEPTHPLLRPKEHVAGMAELEAIRDDLIERLKMAREAAEGRGERQRRARARLEEMVRDPSAHKWETVSNEELGDPGCAGWKVAPRWGPVGALMNWWRVKVSSGCPLAGPREAVIWEAR